MMSGQVELRYLGYNVSTEVLIYEKVYYILAYPKLHFSDSTECIIIIFKLHLQISWKNPWCVLITV